VHIGRRRSHFTLRLRQDQQEPSTTRCFCIAVISHQLQIPPYGAVGSFQPEADICKQSCQMCPGDPALLIEDPWSNDRSGQMSRVEITSMGASFWLCACKLSQATASILASLGKAQRRHSSLMRKVVSRQSQSRRLRSTTDFGKSRRDGLYQRAKGLNLQYQVNPKSLAPLYPSHFDCRAVKTANGALTILIRWSNSKAFRNVFKRDNITERCEV
jgi:hypothetical protein